MKAILYPSILISISIISTTPSGIRFPDELEDGRRSRVFPGANVLVISFHPERQQSSHQFLMRRGRFTIKLALSLSPWGNWVGDTTANILPEKHVWLFKSLPLPLGAKVNVHIWIFSSVLSWYQAGQPDVKAGCSLSQFCALAVVMPLISWDFMEITLPHHASVSLFVK